MERGKETEREPSHLEQALVSIFKDTGREWFIEGDYGATLPEKKISLIALISESLRQILKKRRELEKNLDK